MVFLIAQYVVTDTPQDNGAFGRGCRHLRLDFETAPESRCCHRESMSAKYLPAMLLERWLVSGADRCPKASVNGPGFPMPCARPGAAGSLALILAPYLFAELGYWD